MEKRHRRGLSKQAVSDSYFSSLALIRFWVFDCKLNEQGGELLSVSSRPPAVENLRLFWGEAAITSRSLRWIWVLKSALTLFPTHPSMQRDPDSRNGLATVCAL